jgi:large subunit ribosomal protein L4
MAIIDVYNLNRDRVGSIDLDEKVFNADFKEHLVHDAIRLQLMNRRSGTVAVKNRAAVSGSGKKPFKQKGTGQARQGCKRASQYPGGGVAFGPKPKIYNLSMNKKAHKGAIKSALSYLFVNNKITIVDKINLEKISTKQITQILNKFEIKKTLVITSDADKELVLSARNVKAVKVLEPQGLNVYDIVSFNNIVITEDAVKLVEGALKP